MLEPSDVLIRTVITEKASSMSTLEGKDKKGKKTKKSMPKKYVFEVAMNSNKIDIAKAVEKLYKVKVSDVNTMIMKPKRKRIRTQRNFGYTRQWKKAIVTLSKGEIDIYKV